MEFVLDLSEGERTGKDRVYRHRDRGAESLIIDEVDWYNVILINSKNYYRLNTKEKQRIKSDDCNILNNIWPNLMTYIDSYGTQSK